MGASMTITRGGRMVDLLNVTPEDIDLADIAWALAHTCRFSGHTRRHYSVAEHSINVARLLPEPIKIYGLLHDAHEAYIGDISTPMKQALGEISGADRFGFDHWLSRIEQPIIKAIHNKLGVPWPVSHHVMAAVKYADATMCEYELQQLFAGRPRVPKAELPMPAWNIDAPGLEWQFPVFDGADPEAVARVFNDAVCNQIYCCVRN